MPWIASLVNDSTDGKMSPTLNGPSMFMVGPFYGQYGTGVTLNTSTTEWSLLFNIASSSSTINAATAPTPSTAISPINLSSDPTGKGPGATLYLPGSSQLNVPTGPYGALALGSIFAGSFFGSINNTSTPTIRFRLYLRNAATGAVAYTIADTTAFTMATISGGPLGIMINPSFSVSAVGATGSIIGNIEVTYGPNGWFGVPITTAVDTRQSYILDLTAQWGTSSASNALNINTGAFELLV